MAAWEELLQKGGETLVSPWLGGRQLRSGPRLWAIDGRLPREIGWYCFKLANRRATIEGPADLSADALTEEVHGYLVGDRLVLDNVHVDPRPDQIAKQSESVALLDPGLDRFVRVSAGRFFERGPLVFKSLDFPLGPEDAVMSAFLRRATTVDDIPNVAPALDAAFRMESYARAEAERRRAEVERQRAEEEARRQLEERRQKIATALGTAEGRRAMAVIDFAEAARAALKLSGAEYLDHKRGYVRGEMIVTFRFLRRAFVCSCDERTLRIIDAGICLVDHITDEKGDSRFTLESLPGVIAEADRTGVLVVLRHGAYDF